MSDAQIARRYARALIGLAVDAGQADVVEVEFGRFVDLLAGDGKELYEALRSPLFSADERAGVLNALLPRLNTGAVTAGFLRFVSERGRMDLLPQIGKLFRAAMDERAGRVRVQVSTVEPLTPQFESAIQTAFAKATGKSVVLDARIDPSLIGGLVARVGDRVYDASLRTRLEDIKQRLVNAPAAPEA
jgi:F-type H+-transporting ATPase subunit delta